jgi:LmbE family N-acetylglucosaminyl deacetylase
MEEHSPLRLCGVFAHPDDETLGAGGTLARYAAEGVETYVVTATRGQRGRFKDGTDHPGPEVVGRIREGELRAAAKVLGVKEVSLLDYWDKDLDQADPPEVIGQIAAHLRRIRPHVVITFDPTGAYGHPDHIAICQFATAAVSVAADPTYPVPGDGGHTPHRVSKLYYMGWPAAKWEAYQEAFKRLVSKVDGVDRQAAPWPDWGLTTRIDTADHWETVWKAVQCHETQMAIYGPLAHLSEEHHRGLWGSQEYYRAMSLVNGGREKETDLFEGLR